MPVGAVSQTQQNRKIKVLEAATATNGSPVGLGTTVGVSVGELLKGSAPAECAVFIASTAGSGTMTVTVRAWGYNADAAAWAPLGVDATAASRGVLNASNAVDEIGADVIRHTEPIFCLWAFDQFYLEVTAIGGTATAISAWLIAPAQVA